MMIEMAFQAPLSHMTDVNQGETLPIGPPGTPLSSDETAMEGEGTRGSPGGPPPPPGPGPAPPGSEGGAYNASDPDGTVNSTFEQPLNHTGGYANNTIEPVMIQGGSYTYVTSFGNFTFPAASPHIMSVSNLHDQTVSNASSFVVEGSPPTSISTSVVLSANNTTFLSRYDVMSGSTFQGTVEITTHFNATVRPKLSALFLQSVNSTLTSWHLRWKILTANHYLKLNENDTYDFGSVQIPPSCPSIVGCDATSREANAGPVATIPLWNSTLSANWGDEGTGVLYVGPVTIDAAHNGTGLMVAFPDGDNSVDPSFIALSGDAYATAYSSQKKVFAFGGRYFGFFAHWTGSTQGIRYAVGQEVCSPTQGKLSCNGMAWGTPIPVDLGTARYPNGGGFAYSFDVDHRDGIVALAWLSYNGQYVFFKKGYVQDGVIVWAPTAVASDLGSGNYGYVPSVAIGEDSFFWIAVTRNLGFPLGDKIQVLRSTVAEGTAFYVAGQFPVCPLCTVKETVRLVPLPGGDLRIFSAHYSSTKLYWRTWFALTGTWYRPADTDACAREVYFPVNTHKYYSFTAGALPNGLTPVVYVDKWGTVRLMSFDSTCENLWENQDVDAGYQGAYPALQVDANGDTHVFWARDMCGSCARAITYRRYPYLGTGIMAGSSPTIPFAPMGNPQYLSSSLVTLTQRAFLVYSSPLGGGAEVYFASLPTRRANSGEGGAPWNRDGLSPQGVYFQQLSEAVSPSNGLLMAKQTDLSIPGRGLDLSIQRIYRTPDAFIGCPSACTPWDYEELDEPFYSVGTGWSLNFPRVTSHYLYLWDGQRFPMSWNDLTFENWDGEYFKVVRNQADSQFKLYSKSGLEYKFLGGGVRRLSTITDLKEIGRA